MKLTHPDLKLLLDERADRYNCTAFIEHDPISIPHLFSKKEDIECIGFIIATIAWGNRIAILKSGAKLVDIMGNEPYHFVMNASAEDLEDLAFVHRTFNRDDLVFFILSLRTIYQQEGLEKAFGEKKLKNRMDKRIDGFRTRFLELPHDKRTEKHISSPLSNSACKRINMFLRWMVRKDRRGVDFGIWESIEMSELYLPLDVHTGRVARDLGLLTRKQDDWKSVEELMTLLRAFDPVDPCKYDFALFGIGVNEW